MHEVLSDSRIEIFRRRLFGSSNRIQWTPRDAAEIARHLGLPTVGINPLGNVARVSPAAMPVIKNDSETGQTFTFVISTGSVDRMGDDINQKGWVLDPYRTNPIVLWQHNADLIPVGKAIKVWVEAGRLMAKMRFVPANISQEAEQVRKLVDGGFLCGASVGFLPHEFKFSEDPARPYGISFNKQTLLEWSIVCIPANEEALLDNSQKAKATPRLDRARNSLALQSRSLPK